MKTILPAAKPPSTKLKITPDNIGTGTWGYQWSYSDDNVDYTDISGAESDNYTPPLAVARYYRVLATRTSGQAEAYVFYNLFLLALARSVVECGG